MSGIKAASLPVVLFGYDSSVFTQKVQLALKLKRIPYSFIKVPTMMPRPMLKDNFGITYRKIPVLSIGREMYIDTSLIIEALENNFPQSEGYGTLYPPSSNGRTFRPMMRGFASFWMDRPFFRFTTGLIPVSVWQSSFGRDRESLIGHKIDAAKLGRKVPENLSGLDMHLSILEPLLADASGRRPWIFDTPTPSAADISFFYQLNWGMQMARGEGIENLTAGETANGAGEGAAEVFNEKRYPAVARFFRAMEKYFTELSNTETVVAQGRENRVLDQIKSSPLSKEIPMLETPASQLQELDERNGLKAGVKVSVVPDDTGRNHPTNGTLVGLSPEEIVIVPETLEEGTKQPAIGEIRAHFPRVGFVVRPLGPRSNL